MVQWASTAGSVDSIPGEGTKIPHAAWGSQKKKSTGLPGGTHGKEPPSNAGDVRDTGLTPGSARSPGGEHGNPLQYSCLENPMDRGAWQATVHRAAKSQTQLK